MNVYAYCLCEGSALKAAPRASGLAGGRPRLIRLGDYVAVVSDFADARAELTRENVFAHEDVVQAVLAGTTPLPFRFGTVVAEERLANYVRAKEDALRVLFERLRGRVEMSVKVLWETGETGEAEADAPETPTKEDARKHAPEDGDAGPGTAFLHERQRAGAAEERRREWERERAEAAAALVSDAVDGLAQDASIRLNPTPALLLAAAHLVERSQSGEYRERVQRALARHPELRLLVSGPWPPYSFSQLAS